MYAEPIEDRIDFVMAKKERVIELLDMGWTHNAIANYLGSDKLTIKRFIKKVNYKPLLY